jgi:hypothetical protein
MVAIKAHFDGKSLILDEPADLPRNQPLLIHVQPLPEQTAPTEPTNLWEVLEKYTGTVEAPPDWSAEHDHYLYGTPKRNQTPPPPTEAGK